MKLASLKHGRDGRLVVVSQDLTRCLTVPDIAPTLLGLLGLKQPEAMTGRSLLVAAGQQRATA